MSGGGGSSNLKAAQQDRMALARAARAANSMKRARERAAAIEESGALEDEDGSPDVRLVWGGSAFFVSCFSVFPFSCHKMNHN